MLLKRASQNTLGTDRSFPQCLNNTQRIFSIITVYVDLYSDYVSPMISETRDRPTLLLVKKGSKLPRKARLWISKYLNNGMFSFENCIG